MKSILTSVFALMAFMVMSFHSHHSSHHSSSHSSSHHYTHTSSHSSGHTMHHSNPVHPYRTVKYHSIHTNDIHRYNSNNRLFFYYLLFNNNTNKHDTIFARSHNELKRKVSKVSKDPNDNGSMLLVIGFFIPFVLLVIIIVNYKWKNK